MNNDTKMRALILHVCEASKDDRKFGAVKLNKVLFYSDFVSFLRRGESITGQEYFAIKDGPAPQQMVPILRSMRLAGEIKVESVDVGHNRPMERTVALRSPADGVLTFEDISIANEVIKKFSGKTGTDLTTLSHKFAGWKIAFAQGPKTIIKYSMAQLDAENLWDIKLPPIPKDLIDYGQRFAGA